MSKTWRAAAGGAARSWRLAGLASLTGVLLAGSGFAASASAHRPTAPAAASAARGTGDCDSLTTCFTPRQIRVAYGIQALIGRGIDGRGETVVLPELAEQRLAPPLVSNIRQDLADFDRLFGLPAARLQVVRTLAPGASPWLAYGEETLDAEMVHAIAPAATIRVVLIRQSALTTPGGLIGALTAAVRLGVAHGDVISISAGGGEGCFTRAQAGRLHAALRAAARHRVTVVAAAGDTGPVGAPCTVPPMAFTPVREVSLPASDPLVLAAGGTTLYASHRTGAYFGEKAWGLPFGDPGSTFQAGGGGFSRLYARPGYQRGVPGTGAHRSVPDVAADANGHTGMVLVISSGGGKYTLRNSGGTSASAPLWAGVIALADQYAGRDLGLVNPAIYQIGRGRNYRRAFHDVTIGTNTVLFPPQTFRGYRAARGWDPVTGWGSPDAAVLIPLLARYAGR